MQVFLNRTQLARSLNVSPETIRKRIACGAIVPTAKDALGRDLFDRKPDSIQTITLPLPIGMAIKTRAELLDMPLPKRVMYVNGLISRIHKASPIQGKHCFVCGTTDGKIDCHHEDYSFPLEVTFLCPMHHSARHVELGWGTSKQANERLRAERRKA